MAAVFQNALHATTNFLVEVPTDVTAKMESFGLENNEILLIMLAFQIGCVFLLIKGDKVIPNLVRATAAVLLTAATSVASTSAAL